jgi:hypothetical protein
LLDNGYPRDQRQPSRRDDDTVRQWATDIAEHLSLRPILQRRIETSSASRMIHAGRE